MASGSPTYPSPMIPNRISRAAAFLISSSATDISMVSPVSPVKPRQRLHNPLLLCLRQLRIHRQGEHLRGGRLVSRQAAPAISQVRKAGLQMQGKRIVHRTSDAVGLEMLLRGIPPGRSDGVLMED